jgi:hypothetical protein
MTTDTKTAAAIAGTRLTLTREAVHILGRSECTIPSGTTGTVYCAEEGVFVGLLVDDMALVPIATQDFNREEGLPLNYVEISTEYEAPGLLESIADAHEGTLS